MNEEIKNLGELNQKEENSIENQQSKQQNVAENLISESNFNDSNSENSVTNMEMIEDNLMKKEEETLEIFEDIKEISEEEDDEITTDYLESDSIFESKVSDEFKLLNKEEILDKLRYFIHETNVIENKNKIEELKTQYYKIRKSEYDKYREEQKEHLSDAEIINMEIPKDPSEEYFKELLNDYKTKKQLHFQEQEKLKLDNLHRKEEIIEKIKTLANSEESLKKTFDEFKALQKEWQSIGPVPANKATEIWKNYQLQIERFYDFVKINNELRDLDLKKNLEQKLELCEKAEELLLSPDIIEAYNKLQEYHDLWKELGPVPKEKREEVWERFSLASKKIRQAYQEHFEKIKEERESNYKQKLALCEKAEEILEQQPLSSKEWTELSEKILELQKIWKTIGMVPKNVNNEVYERFRNACNKFFEAKNEFFAEINNELNENLQKKLDICVNAELLKDRTDWKRTTEKFLELQKQWKEIGPVPKKHSEQIWKRFRAACDHFFNAKAEYFKNIESEVQNNLTKKEALIEEVKNFQLTDNHADNVSKIKEFQNRWAEIGNVPVQEKDRLYNEFKNAINQIFEKLNLNRDTLEINNFKSKVDILKETNQIQGIQKERNKIQKRIQELNAEIIQIETNLGFFSSGSEQILKEFNKKIEKAREEIKILKEKKKILDLAERDLKSNNDSNEKTE